MKKIVLALMMIVLLNNPVFAAGGIELFLNDLNVQARADQNGFSAKLSAQFGVPLARVQVVIKTVKEPADAFMCFQLGQMTQKPSETVMKEYQANKGKGWGVIAKNLGIKPGSPEFHALKNGDFVFNGEPGKGSGKGKGKGKGKGRNRQ
ncbi:MAG: hypothetical protein ABH969_08550 [Pseudomonadota bacterium]